MKGVLKIYSSGKVGFGTTNPSTKLHVISQPFYATRADLNAACELITNMIKLLQNEIRDLNGNG